MKKQYKAPAPPQPAMAAEEPGAIPPPHPMPAWKAALIPILIFWTLGAANLFHPLLFSLNLGDIGDTLMVKFQLEHQYKVLTDPAYPGSYSTAPFWYPESENNLARSDMLVGAAPVYILPRLFLSRENAFHAFLLLAATLNFLAFFWLCRSQGVQPLVACLAAWVFAFGMHKTQHTVHAQFYVQFWGVLFFGWLLRFLQSPGPYR